MVTEMSTADIEIAKDLIMINLLTLILVITISLALDLDVDEGIRNVMLMAWGNLIGVLNAKDKYKKFGLQ